MRHKVIFDSKLVFHHYVERDVECSLNEAHIGGLSPKIHANYLNPNIIKNKLNDLVFKIHVWKFGHIRVLHRNKLKHFKGNAYCKLIDACKAVLL